MVEKTDGFTKEKAKYIQRQIQRERSTALIEIPDILSGLFGRKTKKVPLREISGEIVPFMDLEPAEKHLLRAGFDSRIIRLSYLYLDRMRRSFFTFKTSDEMPDDPDIIARSQELDTASNNLIEANVQHAQSQLMQIELSQLQNQWDQVQTPTQIAQLYIATMGKMQLFEDIDSQPLTDSNPARGWLKQAHSSGTILGATFYDKNINPVSLKQSIKEQNSRILAQRELVPPEVRKLINGNYLTLAIR